MLLSMTGFGESHCQHGGLTVAVEVRAINSRFFKLTVRVSEGYGLFEPRVEELVRQNVRRGTIQVNLRVDRVHSAKDFKINADVLNGYRTQLQSLCQQWGEDRAMSLDSLLPLPGVVEDLTTAVLDPEDDWPVIRGAVQAALTNMEQMRKDEGRAMADDLAINCRAIAAGLVEIDRRAPLMLEAFRVRLTERLTKVLAEHQVVLDPSDLIKEISLFADRGDISEEIVRLRSHLDQFDSIVKLPESAGRKLEFLTQEMNREANTIGSKSNDVEIARHVIEIKTAIERIREMIQNIE